MDIKDLLKLISRISFTGPGGIEKIVKILKELVEKLNTVVTEGEIEEVLSSYYTKEEVQTILNGYVTDTQIKAYYTKEQVDLIISALGKNSYRVAWDGSTQPTVANIPAGVVVTYNNTDYIGTLSASANTINSIYLVGQDMYVTSKDGNIYSWVFAGTTELELKDYATKEEVTQLEQKVSYLGGKYYGFFADEENLPEGTVPGFAYVGEGPTYNIWNFNGEEWKDAEITVNQSPIGNNEDINQDESGKLQFANRTYNAQNPNGMGYVILRKNATFASQVTDTNTIYEIRYDFDLDGEDITVPSGCRLYFNGGNVKNGTIIGANIRVGGGGVNGYVDNSVFPEGYNIISGKSGEVCIASEIGMIPNDASAAAHNGAILDIIIALNKKLTLDGEFYFGGNHNVTGNLEINGGKMIVVADRFFTPKVGSSLRFSNCHIVNTSGYYFIADASNNDADKIDYVIDSIIFEYCTISSGRIVNLKAADLLYSSTPYGLKRFVVNSCNFINITNSLFILSDFVVSDEYRVTNNFFDKFIAVAFSCGTTNEYSSSGQNRGYQCDFIVEGNEFVGKYYNGSSYYCPILFESNRVFYRNNVVREVIAGGDGQVAYDGYVSSEEYFSENNTFINICNLPESGTPGSTRSEIFKSKGAGSIRYARGNRWEIDFNQCRVIAQAANVTFADATFESLANVSIFNFNSRQGVVSFIDNSVIVKNGKLNIQSSSNPVVEALIQGNIFDLYDVDGTALMPSWNSETIKVSFVRNTFNVQKVGSFLSLDGSMTQSVTTANNAVIEITDNVFNKQYRIGNHPCKRRDAKGNTIGAIDDFSQFSASTYMRGTTDVSDATIPYVIGSNRAYYFLNPTGKVKIVGKIILSGENTTATFDFAKSCDVEIKYGNFVKRLKYRITETENPTYQILDEYENEIASGSMADSASQNVLLTTTEILIQARRGDSTYLNLSIRARGGANANYEVTVAQPGLLEWSNMLLNANTFGKYKYSGIPQWWNGTKWIGADGFSATSKVGATADRPTASAVGAGFTYFDTDLGKMIVSNGTAWVNMDGTPLV